MNILLRAATVGMTLVLLLAACGEDAEPAAEPEPADEPTEEPEEPADEPTEEPEEPADEPEEPADEPAGEVTVSVAATDLGDVLVDHEGLTLYVFDNDEGGESSCYDDCTANWPPLVVEGEATAGDGADAALLGTTERTDGTTQVTYDDQPLYHWAGDDAPGDTEGQGVGDVWWVVAPDGAAIRGEDAAAEEERGGYGY